MLPEKAPWGFLIASSGRTQQVFVPVPENGDYQVVLSTDDKVFGGYQNIDKTVIYHTWAHDPQMGDGFVIYLPARTAVVLRKVEKKKD